MLKTYSGEFVWLVEQPDHARVSGYLAAHWGGRNDFCLPGHFGGHGYAGRWRDEFVLAAAQHDNGWWEWEAFPQIDERDGLPLHLTEVISRFPQVSFDRWRRGIPRLSEFHPWAALLVARHALWLYSAALGELPPSDECFRHPLFGGVEGKPNLVIDSEPTRGMIGELARFEEEIRGRLLNDAVFREATLPRQVHIHTRLLQLFDAISLLLCFDDRSTRSFTHIPRLTWEDRGIIEWQPLGDRSYSLDPYPFDQDPLPVHLPIRVLRNTPDGTTNDHQEPIQRLYAQPIVNLEFSLRSRSPQNG